MRFGELVTFLPEGPRVRPKACEAIGIQGNSICWGLWTRDLKIGQKESRSPPSDTFEAPHLIVTPIPIEAWPFVFKLTLELAHVKGSLAKASKIIRDADATIYFAEGSPAGYRRATVTIFGRALGVERKVQQSKFKGKGRDLTIAKAMVAFVVELKQKVLAGNERLNFLCRSLIKKGGFIASFSQKEIGLETWQDNPDMITKAVAGQPLQDLMYLYRCLKHEPDPVVFKYDKGRRILRVQHGGNLIDDLEKEGIRLPARALAHFNTDEYFVRFQLIKQQPSKAIYQFRVDYKTKPGSSEGRTASSKGLIAEATGCFDESKANINLIKVSNSFAEMGPSNESGSVYFFAQMENSNAVDPSGELANRIKDRIESAAAVKVESLRARPLRNHQIFVSMNLKGPRDQDIRACLEQTALELGLFPEDDLVYARTGTESVTRHVIEKLKECHGFFQVFVERRRENQWLFAEHGMAVALGLPGVRIVAGSKDYLKLDRDANVYQIEKDWNTVALKATLN